MHGYAIDYGAYVHLNNTANAVQGTLIGDNDEYIEIPMIDYRSVRRAILDVEAFQYTLVSANTSNWGVSLYKLWINREKAVLKLKFMGCKFFIELQPI